MRAERTRNDELFTGNGSVLSAVAPPQGASERDLEQRSGTWWGATAHLSDAPTLQPRSSGLIAYLLDPHAGEAIRKVASYAGHSDRLPPQKGSQCDPDPTCGTHPGCTLVRWSARDCHGAIQSQSINNDLA